MFLRPTQAMLLFIAFAAPLSGCSQKNYPQYTARFLRQGQAEYSHPAWVSQAQPPKELWVDTRITASQLSYQMLSYQMRLTFGNLDHPGADPKTHLALDKLTDKNLSADPLYRPSGILLQDNETRLSQYCYARVTLSAFVDPDTMVPSPLLLPQIYRADAVRTDSRGMPLVDPKSGEVRRAWLSPEALLDPPLEAEPLQTWMDQLDQNDGATFTLEIRRWVKTETSGCKASDPLPAVPPAAWMRVTYHANAIALGAWLDINPIRGASAGEPYPDAVPASEWMLPFLSK